MRTNQKRNRLLSIMLTVSMVLSMVPTEALRAYAEELGGAEEAVVTDTMAAEEAPAEEAAPTEEAPAGEQAVPAEGEAPEEEAPAEEQAAPAEEAEPAEEQAVPAEEAETSEEAPADDPQATYSADEGASVTAVRVEGGAAAGREAAAEALAQLPELDDEAAESAAEALFPEDGALGTAADDDDYVGPVEDDEYERSLDGSNIGTIAAKWVTKDTTDNERQTLLYVKPYDDEEQTVVLGVNYALSGEFNYEPGDVTITIPAHIFKNADGKDYGTLTIPFPEEPKDTKDFNWKLVGDEYVLTNTKYFEAATTGYIEFSFSEMVPHELVDMLVSEPFQARIQVTTNKGNTIALKSNELTAQFDTEARVTDLSKRVQGSAQRVPASEIPEGQRVEGESEYIVVDWFLWGVTEANTVYTLDLLDSIPQEEVVGDTADKDGATEADAGGFIVKKPNLAPGTTLSERDTVLEKKGIYRGYRDGMGSYYYYTTAYPASQFKPDTLYTFHNTVRYTVTERDPDAAVTNPNVDNGKDKDGNPLGSSDPKLVTVATASARTTYQWSMPEWVDPTGHFYIVKNGNDDKEQHGQKKYNYTRRADRHGGNPVSDLHIWYLRNPIHGWYGLYPSGINDLQDLYAESGAEGSIRLSYTVDSIGYAMPWMFDSTSFERDGAVASRLSRNYYLPVTMTTYDEGVSIGRSKEDAEGNNIGMLTPLVDYDFVSIEFPEAPYVYTGEPHNINPDGSWEAVTAGDGTFLYERDNDRSHWPDFTLEALVGGEWQHVATASWKTGTLQITPAEGITADGAVVDLPEGTENWRTTVTLENTSTDEEANLALQAAIDYDLRVVIDFKSTDAVNERITELFGQTNTPSMEVWNKAELVATDSDGEYIISPNELDDDGYDKVSGYTTDTMAYPTKTGTYTPKDVNYDEGYVTIHYAAKVEERSLIHDRVAYEQAVEDGRLVSETHGVWYDLLPKGVVPDLNSIELREGDTITYRGIVDDDYDGTGRILIKVEADLQPRPETYRNGELYYYMDAPAITFDATMSFEAINDYGKAIHNVVAFESGNETIGTIPKYCGEPDDPYYTNPDNVDAQGNPVGNNIATKRAFADDVEKTAMKDLDPERDDPSFVYAGANTQLNILSQARTSLSKEVMVNGDGYWSTGTYYMDENETLEDVLEAPEGNKRTVYEGGQYAYRLRMMSNANTVSSNLVLYDALEDFYWGSYTGGEPNDPIDRKAPHWQGWLTGVDTSQLEAKGCDPVVYYTTYESSDGRRLQLSDESDPTQVIEIEEATDLENSEIWTRASEYTGSLDDVTGVAIDARYADAETKEPFELQPLESVTVILRMRAPSGEAAREICDAEGEWGRSAQAYNNCYLKCDQTDTDTGTTDEGKFIRKDYTKVGMVEYQHEVTKAWDDDDDRDGKRPEEITLNLMRDGKPATDDDGNPVSVTIGPDSEGVTVDEDGVWHYAFEHLPYTDPDGNVYRYSVTEGRVDGYTTTVSSTDTESAVTNKHVPETTRVDGQKLWSGDEGDPSARPASIDVTLLADGEPAASQTVTPDKDGNWSYGFADLPRYRDHGTEIEYTVEEVVTDQAGRSYTNEVTGSAAEGYTITNTYHPYGELFVTKTVEDATAVSEQQEFELTFVFTRDVDGETQPVTASYAYDVLDAEGNVVSSGTVATNGTVAVKGGQTVHVKDVDEYVKYKVTESEEAGFTLTASEGLTGTISPNEASEASLTNTYRATGKFGPKALKTLKNRELRRNQFRFLLYQVTDEGETLVSSPGNEKAGETTTREDGTLESSTGAVNFSTLRYTEADAGKTFEYVIREYIPATATNEAGQTYGTPGAVGPWKYKGVTYDETEYELEVSVTDNGDGTLKVEGTYKKDGVVVDEPESDVKFTNNYSAKGDVTLKAWKDLKGRKVEDGEFTFELLSDGVDPDTGASEVIQTKDCDANGEVTFDTIEYDETQIGKTFHYYVREVQGSDATVTYDPNTYGYTAIVHDDGDGHLSVSSERCGVKAIPVPPDQAYTYRYEPDGVTENEPVVFTNTLKPGGLTVTKTVTDAEDADPNQEFKFRVVLSGDDVTDETVTGYTLSQVDPDAITTSSEDSDAVATSSETSDIAGTGISVTTATIPGAPIPMDDADGGAPDVLSLLDRVPLLAPTKAYAADGTQAGTTFHATDDMLQGTAYAVLDSAGTLTFFRSNETYANKTAYDSVTDIKGNAYSGTVYAGFETETYTSINPAPWYEQRRSVKSVAIAQGQAIKPVSTYYWFVGCVNARTMDLSRLDTSSVTSMSSMFNSCSSLASLDVSGWDTGSVKDMTSMFNSCSSLTSLDLSGFDTGSVTSMSSMFIGCRSLASLDVSGFDTGSATSMDYMFHGCYSLTSLDLSGFDTGSVMDMYCMFFGCSSLASLDVSGWDTGKVTNMGSMFYSCSSLTSLDLSGWDTGKVTNMAGMFSGCSSLTSLDLSGWDTGSATNMRVMFSGCSSLTSLDLSGWDTGKVTHMDDMFDGMTSLREVSLGADFKFKGAVLPTPDTSEETWVRDDGTLAPLTAGDLRDTWNPDMAGTWIWAGRTYKVTFDANGGAGSMASKLCNVDYDATLPANRFARFGYDFAGWEGSDGNDYEDGQVIPAGTFEVGAELALTAKWEPRDTSVTMRDGAFEFTLHANEMATFDDIPAGTSYAVYEETPDGWVLVEQSNVSGTIEPTEHADARFENKYQPGTTSAQFSGVKLLDGLAAEAGSYTFELLENGEVIQEKEVLDGGFVQFDVITYEEAGTHAYTIREVDPKDPAIDYDSHKETVTVEVTDDGKGNLSSEVTYDRDGIRFENKTRPGELRLTKAAQGATDANADDEFTFEIELRNPKGQPLGSGDTVYWYVEGAQEPASDDGDGGLGTGADEEGGGNPLADAWGFLTGLFAPTTAYAAGASTAFHATDDMLRGTAYAVLDSSGTLTFFRSKETYTNGSTGTFTDIKGNAYSGTVYAGFETETYTWSGAVPWYAQRASVKSVAIAQGQAIKPVSTGYWFYGCSNATTMDLSRLDTSSVTSMSSMFDSCSSLASLDVSGFDTGSVTNMEIMFSGCSSLTSLDLSGWDTGSVTSMFSMFSYCSSLASLDVSGWDTGSVTSMGYMFKGCSSLTSLDLSGWDTGSVTSMSSMFDSCSSLASLDVSGWDTGSVTSMSYMFYYCSSLTSLDLSGWDTGSVTSMGAMFPGCSSLRSLDVSGWDTGSVTNMNCMFDSCSSLESLDLSGWDTGSVGSMGYMFYNCRSLESLDVSGFDTGSAWDMYAMFSGCSSLESVALGPKFTFRGSGSSPKTALPDPPTTDGYTGKWVNEGQPESGTNPATAANLAEAYDGSPTMVGTWVWDDTWGKVVFDANGGLTTAERVRVPSAETEVTMPGADTTERPHFTLAGWNTEADGSGTAYECGGSYAGVAVMDSTVTLYAQWAESDERFYKVKHYLQPASLSDDHADYALVETETLTADRGTEVTPATRAYAGFAAPEAQTATVADDDSTVVDYYYDRSQFDIVFDGNGATSGSMEPQGMLVGISAELSANAYAKTGSLFNGWNTAADGSGRPYTDGQAVKVVDEDGALVLQAEDGAIIALADTPSTTLYAQWLENGNALTPTNGKVTVKCKAGETIVLPDLPAGTTYTITEVGVPAGWAQSGTVGTDGTIVANETSPATVTNTYTATGSFRLEAHKRLEGGELASGAYTFQLKDSGGKKLQEKSNGDVDETKTVTDSEGNSSANPWLGTAPVEFDEIKLTQDDIGKTYEYTIAEVAGSDGTITYDTHTESVTVKVRDAGHGLVVADVTYDDDGALFTNTEKVTSLEIEKTIDAPSELSDTEFEFTVTLKGKDGEELDGAYKLVTHHADSDEESTVSSGGTVTLVGGETAEISGLPVGGSYEVKETPAEGWETVSNGESGALEADTVARAEFTNTWDTTQPSKGKAAIVAHKVLTSGTIDEADDFSFQLLDSKGTVLQTKTVDEAGAATGDVTFDPIAYTTKDADKTFSYRVREVAGDDESVVYDDSVHTVMVSVGPERHNGVLTTDVRYVRFDAEATVADSVTTASATSGDLTVGAEVVDEVPEEGFAPGDTVSYLVTVTNSGTGDIAGLKATDSLGDLDYAHDGTLGGDNKSVQFGMTHVVTAKDVVAGKLADTITVTATGGETELSAEVGLTVGTETWVEVTEDPATFTNTVERVEISGTKVWNDADDADGSRPSTVYIKLLANGYRVATTTATAADGWAWKFENLAKSDDQGNEIAYTVAEASVEDYASEVSKNDDGTFTVTNTELTEIDITKRWDDSDDEDEIRPTAEEFAAMVHLWAGETEVTEPEATVTDNGDGTYTVAWGSLPKYDGQGNEIAYKVTEDAPEGYRADADSVLPGETFVNTHKPGKVSVEITKAWSDGDDADGVRPSAQDFADGAHLFANGVEVTGARPTVTDRGDGTYLVSYGFLEKYDAEGVEIAYTVSEDAVAGYEASADGPVAPGSTITNTHAPETTEVSITKSWSDSDDADGVRPTAEEFAAMVHLYADGVEVAGAEAAVTDNGDGTYTVTWSDLPKNAGGRAIAYTASEDAVAGYESSADGPVAAGSTITNTHAPETTEVSITKSWSDSDDADGVRPTAEEFAAMVHLYADGVEVAGAEAAVTDNGDGTYTVTWSDLPKNAGGRAIAYTASEDAVAGYESSADGPVTPGSTITNTHEFETVEVSGSKTWDDGGDEASRPESITIRLLADGVEVGSRTVTADDGWAWSWTGLPKRSGGEEIAYAVVEDAIEGWATTVSGYDVVNTPAPDTTSVSVSKVWADNGARGGRPASVTVRLTADGAKVGEDVVLDAANGWSHTWSGLAVGPAYAVEEVSVPAGYEASVARDGSHFTVTNRRKPGKPIVPKTGDLPLPLAPLAALGIAAAAGGLALRRRRRRA